MRQVLSPLRAAAGKYEERSLRERILLAIAAIAVVATLWHFLLFQGQLERARRLQDQTATARQEIASLEQERAELSRQTRGKERERLRKKAKDLRESIRELDTELRRESAELVSPGRMAKQLRGVLSRSEDLELRRMENRPPTRIELSSLIDTEQELDSDSLPELYRHPLSLTFTGNYPQAVRFFSRMKEMESRFFWDRLEFTVTDHPKARVRVTVHTLSLDQAWIGF